MRRILTHAGERHLVSTEGSGDGNAIDHVRPGPPLGRAQDDRRPARLALEAVGAGIGLDCRDGVVRPVEGGGEILEDRGRIVAAHETDLVAMPFDQGAHVVVGHASHHGGIGDLVAVEMQDRQHRAIARRVQEGDALPAAGQRGGFCLAVADHRRDQQIGVVEGRAEGMAQHIPKLAAFMDRSRGRNADVTGNAARGGELAKEGAHARFVFGDGGIDFGIGSFQIDLRHDRRPAVAGSGEVDGIDIAFLDEAVELDVDEIQPRRGAPMAQQAGFDLLRGQRLAQAAGSPAGRSARPSGNWMPASSAASCPAARGKAVPRPWARVGVAPGWRRPKTDWDRRRSSCGSLLSDELDRVARDHPFLVGRQDHDAREGDLHTK